MNKIVWWLFCVLCVFVGLYPILYLFIDHSVGLLSTKDSILLSDRFWNIGFYGHITFGGISLLVGWTQFVKKLRINRVSVHRSIGKLYIICVIISGTCGVYIAQFATGGISNVLGFSLSGIVWLFTTLFAFKAIVNRDVSRHQSLMIYSYAICFSAVTLRIWLPMLTAIFGGFNTAYLIVGWLSWVPNLGVAYLIDSRRKRAPGASVVVD